MLILRNFEIVEAMEKSFGKYLAWNRNREKKVNSVHMETIY